MARAVLDPSSTISFAFVVHEVEKSLSRSTERVPVETSRIAVALAGLIEKYVKEGCRSDGG